MVPFISRELLRLSIESLYEGRYSPLLIVSLPCMFSEGIPTCQTAAEAAEAAFEFGSPQERNWLDRYFRVPGGPADKPYFMPATRSWVQSRYPDRSTQRQRVAYQDSIFFHPTTAHWALRPDAAKKAADRLIKNDAAVPLVALMGWMWREREIEDLPSALEAFVEEHGFDRDGFLDGVYSRDIPEDFLAAGLAEVPIRPEDLAELTGAVPPPPPAPTLAKAVAVVQGVLAKKKFRAPAGLVERILGGWFVGDIVVLVGATGSGKTTLARHFEAGLEALLGRERFFAAFLEVTPDYDLSQFLGYENLAGEYTAGQFAKAVLFRGAPSDPRLVVLDEWNLAQIDAYLAPVLSAIESHMPLHLPGRLDPNALPDEQRDELLRAQPDVLEGQWRLPEDTFFIATCNSWLEEPETRLPISGPVKRRCRIIPMPNVLVTILEEEGRDGLIRFCDLLLDQEREAVRARAEAGRSSILDRHRSERLEATSSITDLPDQVVGAILQISRILLDNIDTRASYTAGILRDLLLAAVYAEAGHEYEALGQQVADKILHQIHGDPQILRVLHGATRDFPNAAEIESLIRQMGGLGNERRIRPLV